MVAPAGCIQAECRYLYSYDDEASGRRYMGCLNNVYSVEIDVELFREAERTRHGFGSVKLSGRPLPQCRFSVDRAYHGGGEAFDCVNPRFFEAPYAEPAGASAFDLRDRL